MPRVLAAQCLPECLLAMAQTVKTVLVLFGDRSRPVTFKSTEDVVAEKQVLKQAIKDKFEDVLSPENDVYLQLKDSKWDGMFVDLQDQSVENHDVLKAVPLQVHDCVYMVIAVVFTKSFLMPVSILTVVLKLCTNIVWQVQMLSDKCQSVPARPLQTLIVTLFFFQLST